ncbi:alpha/beta fold hydrolase [Spirulina sp. CS-785/01]|uniref:alpha/beta fold hydrolase n=1 Tax=Spirulina sp. CS-785/01 TaxID=3021716 RepID=UPI002330CC8F|nr:alpha/beta fold hydrolase [Spirulina sp. CS-785/01]MDB9311697.1 alpha/beta fold hydrolase [Spirulina sp. CS-785/01]
MTASITSLPLTPPKTWQWRGFRICYQQQGETGVPVVLIHGFGASWGHWRKNIPALGEKTRCYALDLIGFGASEKPQPREKIDYTFETWAQLVADFCREVVGGQAILVGNSIGCIVAMQTAVSHSDWVLGVVTLNFSLRLLHNRKRKSLPWHQQVGTPILQKLLKQPWFGRSFFKMMARPPMVRNALKQAYTRSEAVTNELVDMLMKPASDVGAADVFVAFTTYSDGPLPEDLIPLLPCRLLILWGADDPWEPLELAQQFAHSPTVDRFIPLEGLGHCPQDEAPEVVNPILLEWIEQFQLHR